MTSLSCGAYRPQPSPGRLFALATSLLAAVSCGDGGGSGGVVAAATPEAAEAGARTLAAGGNAVDAAVAISFALAVTEPAMSGLGGQTQILLYPGGGPAVVVNGTSLSPARTPAGATATDLEGRRASTVPSTVKVLAYAWERFGSGALSWADLLAPAIRYAEEGFVVGPFRARVWQRSAERLRSDSGARALFLHPDGRAPSEGETWRQPALGRTLRLLADGGADVFYQGAIADAIAADMSANGGWITRSDLSDFPDPAEIAPITGSYRDFEVATMPPPGGGWVVLQILNVLELAAPSRLAPGTASRAEELAGALRIGHASRRLDPVTDLVEYRDAVTRRTSKEEALRLMERSRDGAGETTHFSVADGDGTVVAATASINAYFGARAASEELGFLYNDYMREFDLGRPEHPFALRPRAMPYSSMSPTVVARNGRPVLAIGSPGSARIISAVAQTVQQWVDGGRDIDGAVSAPRVHVVSPDLVYLEPGVPAAAESLLAGQGFVPTRAADDLATTAGNPYFGGVHAVALEGDRWIGAADPRRDGAVAYPPAP